MYNKFSNSTFSIENAAIFIDETKDPLLDKQDSSISKDSKGQIIGKRVMRQPGFPLIIELKSKRNKGKSKKLKGNNLNMQFKPKFGANLSPVYTNMNGKVIYVMSAKLIKKVTLSIPKNIIGLKNSEYPSTNIDSDVTVEVKDTVIHKKKRMRVSDEINDIYEKEYHTTSENRRMKAMENEQNEQSSNNDDDQDEGEDNLNSPKIEVDGVPHQNEEIDDKTDENKPLNKVCDAKMQQQDEILPEDCTNIPLPVENEADKTDEKDDNKNNDIEVAKIDDKDSEKADKKDHVLNDETQNDAKMESEGISDIDNEKNEKPNADADQTDLKIDPQNNECNDEENQEEGKEDAKSGHKSTPEKAAVDDDDESDEEYSGEGCFIGYRNTDALRNMITTPSQRLSDWTERMKHFKFITQKARAKPVELEISKFTSEHEEKAEYQSIVYRKIMSHRSITASLKFTNSLYFPHKNLVQYD